VEEGLEKVEAEFPFYGGEEESCVCWRFEKYVHVLSSFTSFVEQTPIAKFSRTFMVEEVEPKSSNWKVIVLQQQTKTAVRTKRVNIHVKEPRCCLMWT
jgi:hypothetical protein